jgi:hypothetical protein
VRLEERWRCQMGYEAAAEVVQDGSHVEAR